MKVRSVNSKSEPTPGKLELLLKAMTPSQPTAMDALMATVGNIGAAAMLRTTLERIADALELQALTLTINSSTIADKERVSKYRSEVLARIVNRPAAVEAAKAKMEADSR